MATTKTSAHSSAKTSKSSTGAKSSGTKAASTKGSTAKTGGGRANGSSSKGSGEKAVVSTTKTSTGSSKGSAAKSSKSSKHIASQTKKSGNASNGSGSRKTKTAVGQPGLLSSIVDKASNVMAGIFASGNTGPNAIDLLKNDHRVVEDLFAKVKANEDGNNASVFKKIKLELDTHTRIEENIFYPFLMEKGKKDIKKIVQEGIEEHRQAKMFLSELTSLAGTTDKFKAKIKVLIEDVEHHVKEEEDEMFPMVEDQFDKNVLRELGARMEAEKSALKQSGNSRSKARKTVSKKAA